jgi:hypothetical protein
MAEYIFTPSLWLPNEMLPFHIALAMIHPIFSGRSLEHRQYKSNDPARELPCNGGTLARRIRYSETPPHRGKNVRSEGILRHRRLTTTRKWQKLFQIFLQPFRLPKW